MSKSVRSVELKAMKELSAIRGQQRRLDALLLQACQKGWPLVAREVLAAGGNPNVTTEHGWPALIVASNFAREHIDVVRALLAAGADATVPRVVARCGLLSLPLFLDAGASVDGVKGHENPLLVAICGRSKPDKALALIEAGANVNVRDTDGTTPLMAAATRGHLKVFKALRERGADSLAIDSTGRSALRHAVEGFASGGRAFAQDQIANCRKIIKSLRDELPAQPEDELLATVALGDVEDLKRRLADGLNPDTMIRGGVGFLGITIETLMQGKDLVSALTNGFDPANVDAAVGGSTLLMWAVGVKQPQIVQTLLHAGADPNRKNSDGMSSADLSLKVGNVEIRHLLGTAQVDWSKHKPGTRQFKPKVLLDRGDAGSRLKRLGLLRDVVLARLNGSVQTRDHREHEVLPYNLYYDIQQHAERLSTYHVLEERDKLAAQAPAILDIAKVFFFGEWRRRPDQDNGSIKPPYETGWRRSHQWIMSFEQTLFAAALLDDWAAVKRYCAYPDDDCYRGQSSPLYNAEGFDWPYAVHLAKWMRGEKPSKKYVDQIATQTAKRPRLLLAIVQAIQSADQKAFAKSLSAFIAFHRANFRKPFNHWPGYVVSPDASFLALLARQRGLHLTLSEQDGDFVVGHPL